MHFRIALFLCLVCATSQAQTIDTKVKLAVNSIYLPQFTVREASDHDVQAIGLRLSVSDYEYIPFEFGIHAYGGYGETALASFGFNFGWLITGPKSQFKLGMGLSKIDLERVDANPDEFGPHVGDVSFADFGTEFKPYIEYEWNFFRFGSLFVHTGYRIINGERTVVTAVEPADGPLVNARVSARDQNFFYSASGFEFGVGLSINFPLNSYSTESH